MAKSPWSNKMQNGGYQKSDSSNPKKPSAKKTPKTTKSKTK